MEPSTQAPSTGEYWQFERPPTMLDLVENTVFSNAVRVLIHVVLRGYLNVAHRVEYIGAEAARGCSSCLVAANHSSHLDTILLLSMFPLSRLGSVRSLAAKDYFFRNVFMRLAGFLLANTIPLERKRFDAETFRYCRGRSSEGCNLIIFPEGTRSTDGRMQEFKPGIGRLALDLHAGILPVYIEGAHACFPKGAVLPRPGKIRVIAGEIQQFGNMENTKESWIRVAGLIRERIESLSVQLHHHREGS
jgi:1-acyl-sn-glycerol-3-phosphate acyltransferase